MVERVVELRRVGVRDLAWLTAVGLDPEQIGGQFTWAEAPLQLLASPLRAALGPFVAGRIVWVDGRRAGYIGRSPIFANYEYFLRPWARGGGVGPQMIRSFLADHRTGDRSRAFFVSSKNDRSLGALRRALDALGWVEGTDYEVVPARNGQRVVVRAEP